MERKEIYKPYSFVVETPGINYSKKFELDKTIKIVRGLQLTSSHPGHLYYRGSQRIEISGDELFPEGFESKLLLSGLDVAPSDRYVQLGEGVQSGNGEVKMQYKDTDNPAATFSPYRVTLVLLCELK